MTQTSAAPGQDLGDTFDFDEAWGDGAAAGPRRPFRALVPVIVCLLIGMEVGMGLGLLSRPEPAATASIQVLPDPNLTGSVADSSQANRFVQGQVLVLGGKDLLQAAQEAAPGALALDASATQVGATDVVELRVVADTTAQATGLTAALVDAYRAERQQAYTQSMDASIAVVEQQLKALQSTSKTAATRSRTSQEYTRLIGLRNSLQYNRDAVQVQVPVVEQPRLEEQSRWPAAARDAFVGLVLGGLLGLLLKLVLDRSARRPAAATPTWT